MFFVAVELRKAASVLFLPQKVNQILRFGLVIEWLASQCMFTESMVPTWALTSSNVLLLLPAQSGQLLFGQFLAHWKNSLADNETGISVFDW